MLLKATIYRLLRIGRDGHLDQSESKDMSYFVPEYGPSHSRDNRK